MPMMANSGFSDMLNGVGGQGLGAFPPAPQQGGDLLEALRNLLGGQNGPGLPEAQGPGASRLPSLIQRLLAPDVALPMAAALMGNGGNVQNMSNAFAAAGPGLKRNKTVEMLRQKAPDIAQLVDWGMEPKEALSLWYERKKKSNLVNAGDGQLYDPDTGKWISAPNAGATKPTDDMREYNEAVRQGYKGTMMDYMIRMKEAGRSQVNLDTGEKLPSGYRWKDPNDRSIGVEPIPGGPGEEIPGELAARIGMADEFLRQLPTIREQVAQGSVTGPWDATVAGQGYGEQGQLYQQIQSGVDTLQRLLTGAGMNMTEAREYTRRYLPGYRDTAETAVSKLDRLERELVSTRDMAMRGRGGAASRPQGIGGGMNTTSGGTTWKVR